jgi:sulfane dehydrogenase subunit SoxC
MGSKERDRRQFLKESIGLAGLAVGGGRLATGQADLQKSAAAVPGNANEPLPDPSQNFGPEGPPYGNPSRFERAQRFTTTDAPLGTLTPQQYLYGIITPSSLHFAINHGSPTPDINPQEHRLLIHGMVDRPLIFTLDEVKRFPSVTRVHFLACAGNSYLDPVFRKNPPQSVQRTHGATSCSEWTGVPLSTLLNEAGVQQGASWLLCEGAEWKKHSISIPLTKAMEDTLVVYAQNGEAVRRENGYPLRLLVPGFEGTRNVKFLRRIKVVDRPYMTKWETGVYTNLLPSGKARWFQMEFEPNSVITRPSAGLQMAGPGFNEITGIAWSGGGKIAGVEVSTDGGKSWKAAQIQEPVFSKAHTRFRFPWNWNGGEAVIQSRSTDEWGHVQPTLAELTKIWGVTMDYWKTDTARLQHFNASQPWTIKPDGSIRNEIW